MEEGWQQKGSVLMLGNMDVSTLYPAGFEDLQDFLLVFQIKTTEILVVLMSFRVVGKIQ